MSVEKPTGHEEVAKQEGGVEEKSEFAKTFEAKLGGANFDELIDGSCEYGKCRLWKAREKKTEMITLTNDLSEEDKQLFRTKDGAWPLGTQMPKEVKDSNGNPVYESRYVMVFYPDEKKYPYTDSVHWKFSADGARSRPGSTGRRDPFGEHEDEMEAEYEEIIQAVDPDKIISTFERE